MMHINTFVSQLLAGWRVLLITISIWLVIAIAFLAIYPKQWEATAYISLASFDGDIVQDKTATIALLRSNGVIADVLNYLKLPKNNKNINAVHRRMRIRAIDKNKLELSVRSNNRQLAINIVNGMFFWIKKEQDQMLDGKIESIKKMIQFNNQIFTKIVSEDNKPENQNDIPASLLWVYRNEMLSQQANNLFTLYAGLDPNKVKRTKLIIPVYSANTPVFPKTVDIFIVAAMIGIVTGIIWIFDSNRNVDTKITSTN